MKYKTIQDTVHGSVKFYGPFLELLETPELQRLHHIKQLGLTKLVFPGANHTRLEHSVGTYRVAERMADSLSLSDEEKKLVMAAGLLHDIGHAPYSHTLEIVLKEVTGKDHMDITKQIITGDTVLKEERDEPTIPEILEDHGISPEKVSELIKGRDERKKLTDLNVHEGQKYFGEEKYLLQVIHGPMDADQLDYLLRDSYYTGAVHGIIDIERLLQTIEIHNGNLVISKGGVSAIEGMLVARGLMYSSVYLHKTARIAELMLAKAVDKLEMPLDSISLMTDWELFAFLQKEGGFYEEIVNRLKYRKLYKKCFSLSTGEFESAVGIDAQDVVSLDGIRKLEKEIALDRKIDEDYVLVDVPSKEIKLSEPRLRKTNVKILEDGMLYDLTKFSPLGRALQKRPTQPWALMVSCPEELKGDIARSARKVILRS